VGELTQAEWNMGQYTAPQRDIRFVLHELLEAEREFSELGVHTELTRELMDQVLEQAAKFCEEVLFPLNQSGDQQGCRFEAGTVTTPRGFKEAYRAFCEAGWPGLASEPEYGGQGLPHAIGYALEELLYSANLAWAMYPCLTHGAYGVIRIHGSNEQQRTYLPKLASGYWTGTMCLTEPQAGTDLGLLRTRAEPDATGGYTLTGTKIFVSAGEHDLSENIVHLVLARLPDAPPGSKGISLFIVPKFLPDAEGRPGVRNHVQCGSIEHKMGINGNATCVLNFDKAQAFLLGEPHRGLRAMFVMMNAARIGVGIQGLGLNEIAYQNAVAYAKERLQSRSLSGPKAPDKPADPIIVHADVRRMLLTQRAYAEGGRAFAYWLSLQFDKSLKHPNPEVRQEADDLVSLFTPVLKAFLTDNGFLCTNLAMQVFGGHGYIRESGMDQYVRDARISMIYEGTNSVQALDLLGRKVLMDSGTKLRRFAGIVKRFIEQSAETPQMAEFVEPLAKLTGKLEQLTLEIGVAAMKDRDEVGAAAVDFLRSMGHFVLAYLWARMAKVALAADAGPGSFYAAKLATARFYFQRLLPETEWSLQSARAGASNLFELEADAFDRQ
jgi:alkylation response protein AidB-like acyl-CoA dehydrogenase